MKFTDKIFKRTTDDNGPRRLTSDDVKNLDKKGNPNDVDCYGKTPLRRKLNLVAIITMWALFTLLFVAPIIYFTLLYNGVIGEMPKAEDLAMLESQNASVIMSADGKEMGRFYFKNRVSVSYGEISPHVIDALISTEDARFEEHSGIDVTAFGRVIFKTVLMRDESQGGGSTITQQLAKNLFSKGSKSKMDRAIQKTKEWMIALKLERMYSKEEILVMYLNQFDFLYNAVGIESAANIYFGKSAKDLNVQEAATLVGMVKNPSLYNPRRNSTKESAFKRRNIVFDQMVKAGKLTQHQADSLKQLPIELHFQAITHTDGIAPYFREELRRIMLAKKPIRSNYNDKQKFVDDSIAWETDPLFGWVEKNPKPDGTKYNLYTDGLIINTTIDSRMQQYAEEAVHEHMASLQERFFKEKKGSSCAPYTTNRNEVSQKVIDQQMRNAISNTDRYRMMKRAGWVDEDIRHYFDTARVQMTIFAYNDKGYVDTIMTPRDSVFYHKSILRTGFMSMDPHTGFVKAYVGGPSYSFFQYDMAGVGRRQVGSTAKPFLYSYAMDEGYTPCSEFLNSQPSIIDANGRTWSPRNSGKARVGEMVTLRWALTQSNNWISARLMHALSPEELARRMHNMGITNNIPPVLSLCLGVCDVSVREMVSAYTAFANNGMRSAPIYVTSITDADGNVIDTFGPRQNTVLTELGNERILSILLNVVDEGTGARLRNRYKLTAETGGKTGTTNYNADGWFMALTPSLVSGTWVGGEERYIHFNTMANGQGAEMALPIYGKYITKVYADPTLPYNQSEKFIRKYTNEQLCQGDRFAYEDDEFEEDVEESYDEAWE